MDEPNLMMHDRCDRCSRLMSARVLSYFEDKMICMRCVAVERQILSSLRAKLVKTGNLAQCGYLPDEHEFRERGSYQPHRPERRKANTLAAGWVR